MKVLAIVAGAFLTAFVLLATGFTFGAAVFFAAADDRARRSSAQERTS